MKITLLRHGKPRFDLAGFVRARDLPHITQSYDEAGISDSPPIEARRVVSAHRMVMCSDLPRAVESAQALGCRLSEIKTSKLFRETTLPHFGRGSVLLPVQVWVVLLRMLWFFGFTKNGESLLAMKARIRAASASLIKLASEHESILLVGHGFFNRYLAKSLVEAGWLGPNSISQDYWSYASYEYIPS